MSRLKELREDRAISQNRLAKIAHISQPFLCDLEKGRRGATPETWQKIADALEVDVSELIEKAG